MSRYLQRVLGRTAGQPLGSLRVAQPRRWSSQPTDPFAAADPAAAASPGAPLGTAAPGRSPELDARPSLAPSRSRPGAGVVEEGGAALGARRSRRGVDPADASAGPLLAAPVGRRGARIERHEPGTSATAASSSAPGPVVGRHDPAAGPPGAIAVPSAPGQPPAMPGPTPHAASAASERRDEPSRIVMPLPPAPRRDPAAATEPLRSLRDEPATGGAPRGASFAIAAPPSRHAAPPQPQAPARPEIVIGRISVLVESARPPVAAPRTVVRQVTATPGNADAGGGFGRFGRFGLGL